MTPTQNLSELKTYLDQFKEEMAQIDIRNLQEIPKFRIPNWPEEAGSVAVDFWFRELMYPCRGEASSMLNVRRKRVRHMRVEIYHGLIYITKMHLNSSNQAFQSDNLTGLNRTNCFIIFHQLIDPICRAIIKKLKKRYRKFKDEAEQYNRVCDAVKKSFEPLIPFIVADILEGEEG
ncbi:MAG: hypothetical protein A3B99_03840 [Candidatus Yanofskybacteria bacterium RIFCSPHIGHO2_02_FULL_44_12b]|uniref:Uncharacterized protein n=2 Tax=Candidatus Yanofskyibacteriota TaxID=1752733 RepID=A0A1F8GMR7_9BACT|nr:MAG: hypothetical protein UW79_C0035G0004 [Candidatus Yanofskybacteria bacterium GW2011_GWA2_44_9]OGN04684.1 MAG: hypothetical protein A2659_01000 [Candidatus Yanofskybacteria bacterium RIFCSPHIGHO2_01_FULL_44_24]OGN15652.1 MAG: hypothetical protein A3B99_03840 [Candidatus Yanofskybacteria bacterium RIFCSPHIGHO2_02_FULL_44_12b]OGN26707.1 MAG: hypothetical protein A2925_03925 [Candidatus Yanofskybacteria bacterium RIFCSPLOWO2_01_FULL_44_22]